MLIRPARVPDARSICDLVNAYAEKSLMLHRSLESVYVELREFFVAEDAGQIVGCVAGDIYWGNLMEIRSLAVAADQKGKGVGRGLVQACIDDARQLGITRIFAMTYEKDFFVRLGFREIPLQALPEKIVRECLEWYAEGHRHETAMLCDVPPEETRT